MDSLVLIYDIRGFSASAKGIDAESLGAFVSGAHRSVLNLFEDPPPDFLKNLGDGHLLLWERAPPALVRAVVAQARRVGEAYRASVAAHGGSRRLPSRVGVGIARGEISRAGDDYYGAALNLAARLQAVARPEGVAVDAGAYAALDDGARAGFRAVRVRLKGLGRTTAWAQRPFSWRRVVARSAALAAPLLIPLAYVAMADAGVRVPGGDALRRALDANGATLFRRPLPEASLREAAGRIRGALVRYLLSLQTEEGWIRVGDRTRWSDRFDMWGSGQSACVLLRAPEVDAARARTLVDGLATGFEPPQFVERDGVPYGWRIVPMEHTLAESALWAVAAFAAAVARGDVVGPEERPLLLARLERAQQALELHRPTEDGGWNMFPHQVDPLQHSPYTTSLALLALLQTREAGLPWLDSEERRDARLRATAAYVVATHEEARGRRGWRASPDPGDPISPGLTWQNLFLLLRVEEEGLAEIPAGILADVPERLEGLRGAKLDQRDAGEFAIAFRTHLAAEPDVRKESVNYLWHPWAVRAGLAWLRRAERREADRGDRMRVRRALDRLVVEMADDVILHAAKGYTFVAAETVLALADIPPP